jgi:cell wall-associated NlpC family hydrolase
MITGQRVADEARKWVGAPYLHQGRSRGGVDCLGLALEVCRDLGLVDNGLDWTHYGRLPMRDFMEQQVQQHCTQTAEAVAGSLIVVRWTTVAAHLAICTGPNMIHACASRKRVVEHGYRGIWKRLTHSIWLLPGVTYEAAP